MSPRSWRTARAAVLSLALAFWSGTVPLGADDVRAVERGQRVRLYTTPEGRQITGRLLASDEEAFVIQVKGREERFARESVVRMLVSRGVRPSKEGVLIGLLAPAPLLLLPGDCFDECSSRLVPALVVLAAGAGAGALVTLRERWQDVPVRRVQVTAGPAPGRGVAVALRLSF